MLLRFLSSRFDVPSARAAQPPPLGADFSQEESRGPGERAVVPGAAVPRREWHGEVSVAEAQGELSAWLPAEDLSCFKDFAARSRACGAARWRREDSWFGQGDLGCQRCLKMERMLCVCVCLL